ncbi:MAG: hypothetical protein HDT29_02175 [Clostridiales bacterium]|nr:hypothetical protein [Clostridiales bacterium]
MEKKTYTLKVKNNDKIIFRNCILAICLIALAVIVVGVIACLRNKKYIDLIYYFVALLVVFALQFSTIFLCYELIISYFDGILSVKKSYSGIEKSVFAIHVKEIEIERYSQDKLEEKVVDLCSKGCGMQEYMVKLSGRKYLLNLDDYMYSLIEVKRDLS